LIAVQQAVLVTRLGSIRVLQPQTLKVTGMTRDGVLTVENGKIADPVINFRWNEGPVRVLQNAKVMTQPLLTQGGEAGSSFAPAVMAADFDFAGVSAAV
jgi:hypothetical protein